MRLKSYCGSQEWSAGETKLTLPSVRIRGLATSSHVDIGMTLLCGALVSIL